MTLSDAFLTREAKPEEFEEIGKLMVDVYNQLEGFPNEEEQPNYYEKLRNVGNLTKNENTHLIAAISNTQEICGAVVYFSDLKDYGSGGTISEINNASGFRLLAVDRKKRGKGIAKLLIDECIKRARNNNHSHVYIHSTESMRAARNLYEKLGFTRAENIDFMQSDLPVFGFKLKL